MTEDKASRDDVPSPEQGGEPQTADDHVRQKMLDDVMKATIEMAMHNAVRPKRRSADTLD